MLNKQYFDRFLVNTVSDDIRRCAYDEFPRSRNLSDTTSKWIVGQQLFDPRVDHSNELRDSTGIALSHKITDRLKLAKVTPRPDDFHAQTGSYLVSTREILSSDANSPLSASSRPD